MSLAPVILFTFTRLTHTKEVIQSLRKNTLASQSDVIINSDEGRNRKEKEEVLKVREYLRTIPKHYFKTLTIIESNINKGVDNSVINIVSDIINKYGKVIVLEDDQLTSGFFLEYMNNALNKYKNSSDIAGISGYLPNIKEIKKIVKNDCFLSIRGSSWGWATWKDQWDEIDWDIENYNKIKNDRKIMNKFALGGNDLPKMLKKAMEIEKIPYWDIRRCFNMSLNNKFFVYPPYSLVKNIGCDGTGEHCGSTTKFETFLSEDYIISFPNNIIYDDNIQKILCNFYSTSKLKKIVVYILIKLRIMSIAQKIRKGIF